MAEHRHAELLRIAADNADAIFTYPIGMACRQEPVGHIEAVILNPKLDWRVATPPKKKVIRWLWASKNGLLSLSLATEAEAKENNKDLTVKFDIKLEWSATEMEE